MNGISNGTKTFGGVIALVAVVSAISAIMLPLGQRVSALEGNFRDFTTSAGTPGTVAALASLQEKFVEVETQFSNLDERTERIEVAAAQGTEALDQKLQTEIRLHLAVIEEKLRHLRTDLDRLKSKHP